MLVVLSSGSILTFIDIYILHILKEKSKINKGSTIQSDTDKTPDSRDNENKFIIHLFFMSLKHTNEAKLF